MVDIATLGFKVESTPLVRASDALDDVSQSARRAESAANRVTNAAQGMAAANENVARSATGVSNSSKIQTSAYDKLVKSSERRIAMLNAEIAASGMTAEQAAIHIAQTDLLSKAYERNIKLTPQMTDALLKQGEALGKLAIEQDKANNAAKGGIPLFERLMGSGFKAWAVNTLGLSAGISLVDSALRKWVPWLEWSQLALRKLADVLPVVAKGVAFVAAGLTLLASPAIIGGVLALTKAIGVGMVAAVTALVTSFWIIPIAIAGVLTALWYFNDDFKQIFGVDILGTLKNWANTFIDIVTGAFKAVRILASQLGPAIGDTIITAMNNVVRNFRRAVAFMDATWRDLKDRIPWLAGGNSDPITLDLTDAIKNPFKGAAERMGSDLRNAFADIGKQDHIGKLGDIIVNGAKRGAQALRDLANWLNETDKAYVKLVASAEKRLANMQAEMAMVGMEATAAARLRYETELLAEAKAKNIRLSPQMEATLKGLANRMAETEVATKKLQQTLDFSKDVVGGFVRDIRNGLQAGEGFLKSFANAAANILNKISDRLIDLAIEMIFTKQLMGGLGGGMGGLGGAIASLFGGLFAKGGVFGAPEAFARGGVVNNPTLFKFAEGGTTRNGLMGEAGPEAIMPLKRGSDGSLGVQMHGAGNDNGPRQIVNIINNADGTEVREERRMNGNGDEIVDVIIGSVKKRMADGEFDSVQRARFGNMPNRVVRG